MNVAIAINSVAALTPTWTTLHLADAFLRKGSSVFIIEGLEIAIHRGNLIGRAWRLDPSSSSSPKGVLQLLKSKKITREEFPISECELLLLRLNPLPRHALNFALLAQEANVQVINDPTGIARTSSKAWLASLEDVPRPRTVVTYSRADAHQFAKELDSDLVVKPLASSGGRGVHRIPSRNPMILNRFLDLHHEHFILQEYLPAADQGEKRLVWANGSLVGGYLRQRGIGQFRHNLRWGSAPTQTQITESDQSIAEAISPHLLKNGIRIAGLDVIGQHLVEVNTLNPGGVHYAEQLRNAPGPRLADRIVTCLTRS